MSVRCQHHMTRARRGDPLAACLAALLLSAPIGCQRPAGVRPLIPEEVKTSNERHLRLFGDFELPRKIGTVENVGLQIPAVSPDGNQVLALHTDQEYLSPMTLLGNGDPPHTPPEGTLSIWLRPTAGADPGRRISPHRWAHSPVWSDSGHALAYVVNEPPGSFIVHLNLDDGRETVLGAPNAVNCLPRFDGDDRTLLFCAAESAQGPFRAYRQTVAAPEPVPLTPQGGSFFFPLFTDGRGHLLCAQLEADHLNWVKASPDGVSVLAPHCGLSELPAVLQTWAGITEPLAPDRGKILFFDTLQNRIAVLDVRQALIQQHRPRSIAACWLTDDAVALATPEYVFAVNTLTGLSPQIFDAAWIPCRYVPALRTLILLGRDTQRRFSIVEVKFIERDTRKAAAGEKSATR